MMRKCRTTECVLDTPPARAGEETFGYTVSLAGLDYGSAWTGAARTTLHFTVMSGAAAAPTGAETLAPKGQASASQRRTPTATHAPAKR